MVPSLPAWVSKIQFMREFGWTERQLMEEVTLETLVQAAEVMRIETKHEKEEQRKLESRSQLPHSLGRGYGRTKY